MKIEDIDFPQNENKFLQRQDYDNMFNVYVDKRGNYVLNLNSGLYLNVSADDLSKSIVSGDKHWPLISYKLYGTTRYAWLLMKLNNVRNPMDIVKSGTLVFHLSETQIKEVVSAIHER